MSDRDPDKREGDEEEREDAHSMLPIPFPTFLLEPRFGVPFLIIVGLVMVIAWIVKSCGG